MNFQKKKVPINLFYVQIKKGLEPLTKNLKIF